LAPLPKTYEKAYGYHDENAKHHNHSLNDYMLLMAIVLEVLKYLHYHKVFKSRVNQKVHEVRQKNQNDQT
jgi:hypothetical protein